MFTFVHSHVQILNLRCLYLVLSFPNWFKWVSYPAALCYTRSRIAFCHLISPLANPENPLWPETIYMIAVFSLDAFERLPSRCFTTVGHTRARILPLMFMYNKHVVSLSFTQVHTSYCLTHRRALCQYINLKLGENNFRWITLHDRLRSFIFI